MDDTADYRRRAEAAAQALTSASHDRDEAVQNIIRAHRILGSLSERDQLQLLRQSPIRSLGQHRVLFRAGDEGRSVIVLLRGFVKLSTVTPQGREVVLEIARPGSLFGELAVLNGTPRQASAVTLTPGQVLAIEGPLFRRLVAESPQALFAAIGLVSARLSATTERELDSVSLPAPVRLAKALLYLADPQGLQFDGHIQIDFRLSQRELGAMTGLIRESINKHLRIWRERGWVELSGGSVTLCDARALRRYVQANEGD